MPSAEPLIVFCNPGDRRSEGIQLARQRLGMPPAILIPYAGMLQGQPLADLLEQAGQRLDGSPEQVLLKRPLLNGPELAQLHPPVRDEWPELTQMNPPVRDDRPGLAQMYSPALDGVPGQAQLKQQQLNGLPELAQMNSPVRDDRPELAQLKQEQRDGSPGLAYPDPDSNGQSGRSGPDPGGMPPLLRLESPGGSFEIERALIALGAPDAPDPDDSLHPYGSQPDLRPLSFKTAGALRDLPGVLHHPSQWFRGYCRLLARIQREAGQLLPSSRWTNDPGEIAAMTDKRRTQQILAEAGVPVPRPLRNSSGQAPEDYTSLRELMLSQRMHRVFIKLASGSAASGVIAYQLNPATGAEVAITTIGVENYITRPPVYYNSGKLRRYTDSALLAGIINWLYRHGAYAEQWIPKPGGSGQSFDIRQLVVAGQACHAVARVSTTPITNLHLRSRRMTPADAGLTEEMQAQVRHTAEQALSAFPRSAVAGIDVLVGSSGRTYTADVNPFGDLLYDVEYHGCSTYEWEMKQLTGRSLSL